MFNFVTADGYFAGTDGNIDWHPVDDEFDTFAAELIQQFDGALFGRVTYDLFAGFWPKAAHNESLSPQDRAIGQALTVMQKVVLTHGELEPDWENTEVWHDLSAEAVQKLKQQQGKDIVIYGRRAWLRTIQRLPLVGPRLAISLSRIQTEFGSKSSKTTDTAKPNLQDSRIPMEPEKID